MGKIVAIAKDGKTITLEVAPAGRGESAPKTADVKLTATTKLVFSGVGVGGAKLTEGYIAHVWTVAGAKDTADRIQLSGGAPGDRRGADLAGKVAAVAGNGKTITFKLEARGRDDAGPSVDIQLTDKTQTLFTNIGTGGAKPTEGYRAEVWFTEGSKDTAARATFHGSAETFQRGEPGVRDVQEQKADGAGKVASVSQDGKTLTLEMAARDRGEAATKLKIKLTDKTSVSYFEVGLGGDRPTDGYMAQVWLADGSKDTAGKIRFRGVPRAAPFLRGKVIGIAKDSKSITLETPGKERGDPSGSIEVKLSPKTHLSFQNVGPDGALLTEGYVAQVTLVEGSTDMASSVVLTPAPTAQAERRRE